MGKKDKAEKASKYKTVEERVAIAEEMKGKFRKLGLSDQFGSVDEFFRILDEYVKPNIFSGFSGKIDFPEADRVINYVLPARKHAEAYCNLEKNKQT